MARVAKLFTEAPSMLSPSSRAAQRVPGRLTMRLHANFLCIVSRGADQELNSRAYQAYVSATRRRSRVADRRAATPPAALAGPTAPPAATPHAALAWPTLQIQITIDGS